MAAFKSERQLLTGGNEEHESRKNSLISVCIHVGASPCKVRHSITALASIIAIGVLRRAP